MNQNETKVAVLKASGTRLDGYEAREMFGQTVECLKKGQSVVLDLKSAEGKAAVLALIAWPRASG